MAALHNSLDYLVAVDSCFDSPKHSPPPPGPLFPDTIVPVPPFTPKTFPKSRFLSLTEAELDGIRHTELNNMVLVEHGVSYICLRRTIQPVIFVPRSQ